MSRARKAPASAANAVRPMKRGSRAEALAAIYSDTGNPLYAWFAVAEIHGGRFPELSFPAAVADYLSEAAERIGEIERDGNLRPSQKTRAIARALGFAGGGSSNPFSRFRRDRADVLAYNKEGEFLFLQRVAGKRPTKKAVLADVRGMAASTAKARLKNGERLHKLWEPFFPRGRRQSD